MTSQITIRRATPADASVCGRILFDAFGGIARKHNFPLDFPSFDAVGGMMNLCITHPKFFGVVAEREGVVVGSNFLDQRDAIAAVGPITVDPNQQTSGVGRRLMQAVIERGLADGHPGIRLVQDAFNTTSMPLYTSLGFDIKEPLALMQGRPKDKPAAKGKARQMTSQDIPACADLCRSVHGFDRANELADAVRMFNPMLLERSGRVVAYVTAPNFWFLNHGVAEREEDMFELLLGAAAAGDQSLALLVPTRNAAFFRWALSQGLRMAKPMSLMAMGRYYDPRGCFYPSVGC